MTLNVSTLINDTDLLSVGHYKTLFEINFSLGVFYVTIVFILSVVGVCGNSLIIYVMAKEKQMNKHARAFIINMACADLCVTGIADPMCIVGAFVGNDVFESANWLCVATASLCLTMCFCVFLNMLSLTLNRWMFICHSKVYAKIYTMKRVLVMCAGCWVMSLTMEMGNFIGWGGHYFDQKSHQCIWDRTASRSYTLFVSFVFITCPMVIIAYCNVSMIRKVLGVKARVNSRDKSWKMMNASLSTAKTLLAMFLVFLICWTPYVTVISMDHHDMLSMETHLFVTLLAHSHSSIVSLVYFGFRRSFREHVRKLFCGRRNATGPSPYNYAQTSKPTEEQASHASTFNTTSRF